DAHQPFFRIDPEIRAVDAAPSVHPGRSESLRRSEIDGESEPKPEIAGSAEQAARRQIRRVTARHQLHSLRAEQPDSIELAAVQQHLGKSRVVVSRRSQPGAAGKITLP